MSNARAKFLTLAAICSAATVFQVGVPTSCAQFGLQSFFAVFDTCSVLNCSGGVFFDLCDPFVTLIDCPNAVVDETP